MRIGLLLALSLVGCRDSAPVPVVEAGHSPEVVVLGELELNRYEVGRQAEIAALREGAGRGAGSPELDSIGAAAAQLDSEQYQDLVRAVEGYLQSHGALGRAHDATWDASTRRLVVLDSLRVERLVLLVTTRQ